MSLEDRHIARRGGDGRRVYQAPQLARVSLKAEEVLVNGCKMSGGPLNALDNDNCGIGVGCNATGS